MLNRLRGEHSIFAKINGLILGLVFGFLAENYYIGTSIAIGYIAGESMGWGEWIGQQCGSSLRCGNEGEKNGIKWLASKFADCGTDQYNKIALVIRGLYWWFPTLMPLVFILNPSLVFLAIIALSLGFQISLDFAKGTSTAKWKHAEYIYGGIQDIVLITLLMAIIYD